MLLDTWHLLRSGGTPESLVGIPRDRVYAIQVSDAPAVAESNLMEETMARRLLPGEGAARVRDVLDVLSDGGCTAPVGVEVFSSALAALPADQAIERVATATRTVLGRD